METCPAELPEEITKQMQHYAERVAEVLGLNTYSRSDFLLNKNNEIYCLEANTLPGMTPTSLLPQEAGAVSYTHLLSYKSIMALKYSFFFSPGTLNSVTSVAHF